MLLPLLRPQTDHETEFFYNDGSSYTGTGYGYWEGYGTYPDAYSVRGTPPTGWKVNGAIVPGETVCTWICPTGSKRYGIAGTVTSVDASGGPCAETTALNTVAPALWNQPFELTCTINPGESCV